MLTSEESNLINSKITYLRAAVQARAKFEPSNGYISALLKIYERLHGPYCKTCPDGTRDAIIVLITEYNGQTNTGSQNTGTKD